MRTTEITEELEAVTNQAHGRRMQGGNNPDRDETLAVMALLHLYGRELSIHDFQRSYRLDIVPVDSNGLRVRVLFTRWWPSRVYYQNLEDDVLVLADSSRRFIRFHGWLPMSLVEEAPLVWSERDGRRTSYWHEVDQPFLFPMPDSFDFKDTCQHLEVWGALWDYKLQGWQCFGCRQMLYSDDDRRRGAEDDRRFGFSYQVPTDAQGSERSGVI